MNLSLLSVKFIYLKKKLIEKEMRFYTFALLRLFHFFKISLSLVCHAILLFLFFFFAQLWETLAYLIMSQSWLCCLR